MAAHNGHELTTLVPALKIRGVVSRPTLARRFVDTNEDKFSYFLGLCLALVLAPLAEVLLTGQSTVVRFISSMENLETPKTAQNASKKVFPSLTLNPQVAGGEATAATAPAQVISATSKKTFWNLRDSLRNGVSTDSQGRAALATRGAAQIFTKPAKSYAPALSAQAAMPPRARAAMRGRASPQGAKPAALQSLSGQSEALSMDAEASSLEGPQVPNSETTSAKPRLALLKGLDPNFEGKLKPLWKNRDNGLPSSGKSNAAASAKAMTLSEAAAASQAASANAFQQAQILQEMAEGINTDFEGPWEKDPILAPLHENLVKAKTAALSAAVVMQRYAGQLQTQSARLMADTRAFAAYAKNPRGNPPAVTASDSVGTPPDVSAQMEAVSESTAEIQAMIARLEGQGRTP